MIDFDFDGPPGASLNPWVSGGFRLTFDPSKTEELALFFENIAKNLRAYKPLRPGFVPKDQCTHPEDSAVIPPNRSSHYCLNCHNIIPVNESPILSPKTSRLLAQIEGGLQIIPEE